MKLWYILYSECYSTKASKHYYHGNYNYDDDLRIAYSNNFLIFQQFVKDRFNTMKSEEYFGCLLKEIDHNEIELPSNSSPSLIFEKIESRYSSSFANLDRTRWAKRFNRFKLNPTYCCEIQSVVLWENCEPFVYLEEEFESWCEIDTSYDNVYDIYVDCLNALNVMMDLLPMDSNLFCLWENFCGILYFYLMYDEYPIYIFGLEDCFDGESLKIHPHYTLDELGDLENAYRVKHGRGFVSIDQEKCFALEYNGYLFKL